MNNTQPRPIFEIAEEIRRLWTKPYFGVVPYLDAMRYLNTIADNYVADSARTILAYALSNMEGWRGADARRIKAEIRQLLK